MSSDRVRKLSGAETLKAASRGLRGTVAEELTGQPRGGVSEAAYNLLKFHGTYEQFDRDTATARKQAGQDKEWQFMVRVRAPGGVMTAAQYLSLDAIAGPLRQRHPEDHQPAGHPVPRHRHRRPEAGDRRDQPRAAHHLRGLRRRGAQRDDHAGPPAGRDPCAVGGRCGDAVHPPAAAKPRLLRDIPGRGGVCRPDGGGAGLWRHLPAAEIQDRPGPPHRTTRSTCWRTTSASWRCSRATRCSATRCMSAAGRG